MRLFEPFEPWVELVGICIPERLLRRKELSDGAKLVYGLLVSYGRGRGAAWPGRETMAADLGTTVQAIKRRVKELVAHELVKVYKEGFQGTNRYVFLRHPWFYEDADACSAKGVKNDPSKGVKNEPIEGSKMNPLFHEYLDLSTTHVGLASDDAENSTPKTRRRTPKTAADHTAEWQEFRGAYPRRDGDYGAAAARKTFDKLLAAGEDFQPMLAGLKRYAAHCDRTGKTGTDKVKMISTFLNGRTWEEEMSAPPSGHLPLNGQTPPSKPLFYVAERPGELRRLSERGDLNSILETGGPVTADEMRILKELGRCS